MCCEKMTGCSGRICTAFMDVLEQMKVERYPITSSGLPDTSAVPEEGMICCFMYSASGLRGKDRHYYLPGISGSRQGEFCVCVAACSLGQLEKGDRIIRGGTTYIVELADGEMAQVRNSK